MWESILIFEMDPECDVVRLACGENLTPEE